MAHHYRRTDVPSDRASDYPDRDKPAGKPIESGGLGPVRELTAGEIRRASVLCADYALTQPDPVECLRDLRGLLGLDGTRLRSRVKT